MQYERFSLQEVSLAHDEVVDEIPPVLFEPAIKKNPE